MLVTLAFIPVGWSGAVAGFILFRVFDVIKPFPAGRLERLHGGLGVMADDAMAAVYANLALRARTLGVARLDRMSADARTAWQSAAIIAVGSELLTPARVDTNSLYLTEQLNALGIDVILKVIVGDDHERSPAHSRTCGPAPTSSSSQEASARPTTT